MDDKLLVSNSKLTKWQQCHYLYHLRYVKKLEKKKKAGPLIRGTVIHECLENYHSGKSWKKPYKAFAKEFYDTLFKEEIAEYGDIPKMVFELMDNYTTYYQDCEWEYKGVEYYFEEPLPSKYPISIRGYIDAVVKEENKYWPVEIKTYKRDPGLDFLIFNPQAALYSWVLQQNNYKVAGMQWDIIKAAIPNEPRVLKSGKLSEAKIDSLPNTLIRGIKKLGFNPDDYPKLMEQVSYEDYFRRYKVRVNKKIINDVIQDTTDTAEQIYLHGEEYKDKNLGKNCAWCSYKDICQAEMLGHDTDFIINAEYITGGKNGSKEEEKNWLPKKKRNRK